MKKIFSIGLVGLLLLGSCNCDSEPYFDIWGIDTYNYNGFSTTTNDSIRHDYFSIGISYKAKYYSNADLPNFSFLPAAVASQPCEPSGYQGTKEKIEKIELIALSDFSADFPKGASLNPILSINSLTEAEFYNEQNLRGLSSFGLSLTLKEKPDSTVQQAFKVDIKLTNGEEYSAFTEPITIY